MPQAADDASPLSLQNDAARFARNDAMLALMCPQAHIISEATSLPKAVSFARQGKHHSKTRDLENKSRVFDVIFIRISNLKKLFIV